MVLKKTPESPLENKEIKGDFLKGNQPWIFIEKTDAQAEAPESNANRQLTGEVPDAGKIKGRRIRGCQRMRWHELGPTPGDGEGQGGLACCSPWGHKELDITGQLNNNITSSSNKVFMEMLLLCFRALMILCACFMHFCLYACLKVYIYVTSIIQLFSILNLAFFYCIIFFKLVKLTALSCSSFWL